MLIINNSKFVQMIVLFFQNVFKNLFSLWSQGSSITCDGRNDTEDFNRICSALKILTFSDRECSDIFKLLAVILHLGNVKFEGESQNWFKTFNTFLKIASHLIWCFCTSFSRHGEQHGLLWCFIIRTFHCCC